MTHQSLTDDSGEIDTDAIPADILQGVVIPPRPAVLADLQSELRKEDPDQRRIARLAMADVALTAALLKAVNSAAFSVSRRIESVDQALSMLGLKRVVAIITAIVLRRCVKTDSPNLTRFWDVAAKRSYAVSKLARKVGGVDVDAAQVFGLFCDVGIPILMQRFPDYPATLKLCDQEDLLPFTEIERRIHGTDHAFIGSLMAKSWGIAPVVTQAIRFSHEPMVFQDPKVPVASIRLIAFNLVAELAIQRYNGLHVSKEWNKAGDGAIGALMFSEEDLEEWIEELTEAYAQGLD